MLRIRQQNQKWVLVCLTMMLPTDSGAETRAFTSRPSNPKECVTGNNISLAWNFTLLPNDSVMEIFFGVYSRYMSKKILAIKPNGSVAVRNSYKRRVFWKGDVTLRTVVVWMYNLTEQDENTYGIFIELGLDKIPLIAAVRVIVQDYPYVSNMTSNKTIQEGDEFLLFCHAKGKPLPQTQLIKVNGTTESKAAMGYTELSIPYARRNDQGWYRCVVTNKVGQDDEFVFVNVQSRIPPSNVAATSQLPSPVFAMIIGVSSISGIAVVILTVHIAKKYGTNLWLYKGRYSQLVV